MIGILAILISFIAILSKSFNHFKYLKLSNNGFEGIESVVEVVINPFLAIEHFSSIFSIMFPIMVRDYSKEKKDDALKKTGQRVFALLIVFYLSLTIFFIYTSVN